MIKAVWFLIVLALLTVAAALIAESPGAVSLNWLGYQVETSVGVLIAAVTILSVLLATIFRIWSFIRRSPGRVVRSRREWRRRRGYKALTQGMVAVAAGDGTEAKRLSKKAENLLAEPPLTMLLSAQAAQLAGDEKAAGKFFDAMSELPETKYLGLSGKLNQALQEGDKDGALELAEQANELKPKTDKVSTTLLDLQIKKGSWVEAEETVRKGVKNKLIKGDAGRRQRAVMQYQKSQEAEVEGRLGEALQLAQRANSLAPSFVPAAVRTARLLQGAGKRRKAASVIEETWVANPHPHLAAVMEDLAPGAGPQEKMRTLEQLASYNRDHAESHIAIASAALAAGMWQEAREHLEAAAGDNPSARVCRLMTELEEGENGDAEASREWLRRAAQAEPDSAWVCTSCGNVLADWVPICERCENFDTLHWTAPPRVTQISPPERRTTESEDGTAEILPPAKIGQSGSRTDPDT